MVLRCGLSCFGSAGTEPPVVCTSLLRDADLTEHTINPVGAWRTADEVSAFHRNPSAGWRLGATESLISSTVGNHDYRRGAQC